MNDDEIIKEKRLNFLIQTEDIKAIREALVLARKDEQQRIEIEETEEVKELLESFKTVLCQKCWTAFLNIENNPKLAKRFYKWFCGQYSNNNQAVELIQNRINSAYERARAMGREEVLSEISKKKYRNIYGEMIITFEQWLALKQGFGQKEGVENK